jgi:hypothetical protein
MGTRSLTFVYEKYANKPFLCMYRQFDGYRDGHGKELAEFLAPIEICNGIGDEKAGTAANGMGCLAAQLVTHFKGPHGIGGFYLHSPELGQDAGQEYEYHVYEDRVKVIKNGYSTVPDKILFEGEWKEFHVWANAPEDSIEDDSWRELVPPTPKKYSTLRDALQHEVISVRFKKADGNERLMNCTTCGTHVPAAKHPSGTTTAKNHDPKLYKVFDLDKQDWRSFREERLINWTVK